MYCISGIPASPKLGFAAYFCFIYLIPMKGFCKKKFRQNQIFENVTMDVEIITAVIFVFIFSTCNKSLKYLKNGYNNVLTTGVSLFVSVNEQRNHLV